MGFQFKPKLVAVMAVINGIAAGASYIVSQGNLGVTVIVTAISVGLSAGVSHYEKYEQFVFQEIVGTNYLNIFGAFRLKDDALR